MTLGFGIPCFGTLNTQGLGLGIPAWEFRIHRALVLRIHIVWELEYRALGLKIHIVWDLEYLALKLRIQRALGVDIRDIRICFSTRMLGHFVTWGLVILSFGTSDKHGFRTWDTVLWDFEYLGFGTWYTVLWDFEYAGFEI